MNNERKAEYVWTKKIRVFHWLNVITLFLLVVIGLIIFNSKYLGIASEGKILLKTMHVFVGYVFVANLLMRIVVGFVGSKYERWRQALPFAKGYAKELNDFKQQKVAVYKGHNPIGKLMVMALFCLMSVQAISGLVLAGTDIYYPPLGNYFAKSIAEDVTQIDQIKPYSKVNVNEAKYKAMREVRAPFITAHIYAFYGLLILIPLHILGVIIAERREKSALVSSMINGYKYLPKR